MPLSTIVVHTSTSNSRSAEVEHDPLEACFVHLAVRDRHPRLGHERTDLLRDQLDVAHAVVHEEHLTFAQQLAADGLRDGRGRRTRPRR